MSRIEWTDRTWNPVTGCTKVSPGCDHCYADAIATLHPGRLDAPLQVRRPTRWFVNSMSDLFHADVPDSFITEVFAVMAACHLTGSGHTFQILTKRPARMRSLLSSDAFRSEVARLAARRVRAFTTEAYDAIAADTWPLPNVWLGVSVETQRWADIRIPKPIQTPAAVRYLSCEPLLGPLDLAGWVEPLELHKGDSGRFGTRWWHHDLDWIIVGGESGPGARPMDLDWAARIVGQCRDAGTPVFVKQLGSRWARGNGVGGKGDDPAAWPADLRVRQMPSVEPPAVAA